MNRSLLLIVACIYFAAGIWISVVGWQKKWGTKGISMRVGGLALVVAGAYTVLASRR